MDPVPPDARRAAGGPGLSERLVAPEVLRAVGRFLTAAVPEPVRAAARAVGCAVADVVLVWPVLAAVGALAAIAVMVGRRHRRARCPSPQGVARAFVELEPGADDVELALAAAVRLRLGKPSSAPF